MTLTAKDSALQVLEGGLSTNPGARMELLRNGSFVKRWHVERLSPQEVASHSHGVAVMLCFICEPSAHLLKAALFHDLAEKMVGDMPAPIKWDYPEIAKFLDELSDKVDHTLGIYIILTPAEKKLLKLADYLDASFYALEQRMQGNRYADAIFNRLRWFFESQTNIIEYPKAMEIWEWLKSKYDELQ